MHHLPTAELLRIPGMGGQDRRRLPRPWARAIPQLEEALMTLRAPAGFLDVAASHGGRELRRTLPLGRLLRKEK